MYVRCLRGVRHVNYSELDTVLKKRLLHNPILLTRLSIYPHTLSDNIN